MAKNEIPNWKIYVSLTFIIISAILLVFGAIATLIMEINEISFYTIGYLIASCVGFYFMYVIPIKALLIIKK